MLITFHTSAWASVTLFGDAAVTLLKMAGHSGTVPGAIRAADVAVVRGRLEQALAALRPDQEPAAAEKEPDAEPPVGLRLRAYPLIQLLTAAAQKRCDVTWEEGAPAV